MPVIDLSTEKVVRYAPATLQEGPEHVCRQTRLFSAHRSSTYAHFSAMRPALSGKPQSKKLYLSRPVPMYGLCTTHLPGKFTGYRSLSSLPAQQTIPHGYSRQGISKHIGQCQQSTRLADQCGLCPVAYQYCPPIVYRRRFWRGTRSNCLCSGFHHNRSLFVSVSMGQVSSNQGRHQTPHASGLTRQYPYIHPYQRWQTARRKRFGRIDTRARKLLRHGSRLPGFRQIVYNRSMRSLLCNQSQIKLSVSQDLLPSNRQRYRSKVRPNNSAHRAPYIQRLPREAPTHQILRCRNQQDISFLTNSFTLPALTIAQLYRCRWQVELFFKWIKQNLRIKSFYGTTDNAVKTQVWIAVSVYVLVAIIKKRLSLDLSLYTILQILSVNVFERTSLLQILTDEHYKTETAEYHKQLTLFN